MCHHDSLCEPQACQVIIERCCRQRSRFSLEATFATTLLEYDFSCRHEPILVGLLLERSSELDIPPSSTCPPNIQNKNQKKAQTGGCLKEGRLYYLQKGDRMHTKGPCHGVISSKPAFANTKNPNKEFFALKKKKRKNRSFFKTVVSKTQNSRL